MSRAFEVWPSAVLKHESSQRGGARGSGKVPISPLSKRLMRSPHLHSEEPKEPFTDTPWYASQDSPAAPDDLGADARSLRLFGARARLIA